MELKISDMSICSFNCRSAKSSLPDIWQLCKSRDIVCLQKHCPFELYSLSQINTDFLAQAISAVGVNVLTGRDNVERRQVFSSRSPKNDLSDVQVVKQVSYCNIRLSEHLLYLKKKTHWTVSVAAFREHADV